jgi:phospholipase C
MGAPSSQQPPRTAGTLPFPGRPVGTPDPLMPFDHVVVVMMENHSFDNILGDLGRTRTDVKALRFDANGNPKDTNPDSHGTPVRSWPLTDTGQKTFITQSWKATQEQVDGGAMDGFVKTAKDQSEPMGYYTPEVLPFAYSLAENFTVGNHWFCSVPGPTYPNRRFLLAGTAYGLTETNQLSLLQRPPTRGTIFDQLSAHHISWGDYCTELPMTLVIPTIFLKYLDHHYHIDKFFQDCEAGSLPAVSFVDPALGKIREIVRALPGFVQEVLRLFGVKPEELPEGETEEDPDDMYYGENWAHEVVEAVIHSPAWERTLLIYTYDEHGGYYDHLPPANTTAPDAIPPKLKPGESGDYSVYGPRVPAIVVSPYSKAGRSTDVEHDHTSVLATIERKWNLPALTDRDANANTVLDFLDLNQSPRLEVPALAAAVKLPSVQPARLGWR